MKTTQLMALTEFITRKLVKKFRAMSRSIEILVVIFLLPAIGEISFMIALLAHAKGGLLHQDLHRELD
jgi:cell shape-determining protein MreD